MSRRAIRVGTLAVLAVCLSGCAALLVGAGAAGGYAVSKDSIRNHFDLPPSTVYRAAREVMRQEGLVTVEDERRGLIKAKVEGANVTITVKRISDKTIELKVRARSDLLMPKIDVAQALYNEILKRL